MIDRIDLLAALDKPQTPQAARTQPTGGTTFSDTLAQTMRTRGAATNAPAAEPRMRAALDAPQGETWRPVKGETTYAEIISGPREGQYINLTRGERRGMTFTIEETGGKKFHVYGEGDTALRVEIKEGERARSQSVNVPRNERWEPVEGHNFRADILNGKRNGWFVNISGGIRHGEVFHVVEKNGKTFHVYGRGDDKLWVEVKAKAERTDATAPTSGSDGTSGSGGTGDTGEDTPAAGSGGVAAG